MQHSTIGVTVVLADGERAKITSGSDDTVTIHATGAIGQPSLHWATLDEAQAWAEDLGDKLLAEKIHRLDARLALDEMDATLRRAGAR